MLLPLPGFEGRYCVTDDGRVWSVRNEKWLKGRPSNRGKLYVALYGPEGRRDVTIHSLVALAFMGPRPEGLVVRHLNGDGADNRLANLAYGTHSENALDQVVHGVHNMASRDRCKNDHEFTEANTYRYRTAAGMGRGCRRCRNEASRRYRSKR